MGKEKPGFLTPKAIANRIKSKGLQKLRWYCQMCQKQCRDENGFKCHTMSESHQRQILLFAESPDKYLGEFSGDFVKGFMDIVSRQYASKRVHANQVYQQYIAHKDHIHMNSTRWSTLSGFVQWLGKTGRCKVDETEKGWFIQYIDRSPAALAREKNSAQKQKMARDDEDYNRKLLLRQVERAKEQSASEEPEFTELKRETEEESLSLELFNKTASEEQKSLPVTKNVLEEIDKKSVDEKPAIKKISASSSQGVKRKNPLHEIMEMEESRKEKYNRKDYWLHAGIVVKIITKKLGADFHKKKAVVREVIDNYGAVVKTLDGGQKVKVDQAHLETVIPAIGKRVLVVNGAYRGAQATLEQLKEERFSAVIKIVSGFHQGKVLEGVQYEDICKLDTSSS